MKMHVNWTTTPKGKKDYTIHISTLDELFEFIKAQNGNPVILETFNEDLTAEIYNDYRE